VQIIQICVTQFCIIFTVGPSRHCRLRFLCTSSGWSEDKFSCILLVRGIQ